jgi:2-methylisocitrate lyase-like PEP mutase family enzyme
VNILAGPGAPPIAVLEQIGVRRVSVGQYPMRATLALLERIASELRDDGTYEAMKQDRFSHAAVNRLFAEL